MTTRVLARRRSALAVLGAGLLAAGALAACGRVGPLEQPPPLFGQNARRDYDESRAARARAQANQTAASRNTTGSAEREANSMDDDAPLTARDVRDPNTQLTTPRDAPVPGAPNPLGPSVSTQPPN